MTELMSLPITAATLSAYGSWAELERELADVGCGGVEAIWGGEDVPGDFPTGMAVGYHLTFYPDWLDFYLEDRDALLEKFGDRETVQKFYGGWGRERLMELYRQDLRRAKALGAAYVVFHVSDVSIEEGYSYRWRHSHQQVIDASVEIANALLADEDGTFAFLVENQWWPGFTMTEPRLTERLLSGIHYQNVGIMLDTGHLMNANPDLRTQEEGVAYIRRMLDAHGSLCAAIRGLHFHQSLSGAYVKTHTGAVPGDLPRDYFQRYAQNYRHILRIDQHAPWGTAAASELVEELAPRWLTHELAAGSRQERREKILAQRQALGWCRGADNEG